MRPPLTLGYSFRISLTRLCCRDLSPQGQQSGSTYSPDGRLAVVAQRWGYTNRLILCIQLSVMKVRLRSTEQWHMLARGFLWDWPVKQRRAVSRPNSVARKQTRHRYKSPTESSAVSLHQLLDQLGFDQLSSSQLDLLRSAEPAQAGKDVQLFYCGDLGATRSAYGRDCWNSRSL